MSLSNDSMAAFPSPGDSLHERMAELGRRGGPAKLARYGIEEYRAMGRVGGARAGRKLMLERGAAYFRELGHRGGMAMRDSGMLRDASRMAGQATLARYGYEHFQRMAELAARRKKGAVERRNVAMRYLLERGWTIPRLIALTMADVAMLAGAKLLDGPVDAYLAERPDSTDPHLFLSRSGKRLLPANMYDALRNRMSRKVAIRGTTLLPA